MLTSLRICLTVVLASAFCSSAPADSKSNVGTYAADLPSASGCGRRVLLELFTDDSFLLVQRYLCRPWSDAQVETGVWKVVSDQVVLSLEGEGAIFAVGEGGLDYSGTRYETAGLHLRRLK